MNENNYDLFKQGFRNCLILSALYVFCMYHNPSAITFPILAGAGIWLLYGLSLWYDKNALTESEVTGNGQEAAPVLRVKAPAGGRGFVYVMLIGILASGVAFTDNSVMIFVAKCLCVVLYFLLALELFIPQKDWTDLRFCKSEAYLFGNSLIGFVPLFEDLLLSGEIKQKRKENGESATAETGTKKKILLPPGTKYVVEGLFLAAGLLCVIVPVMASADIVFKNFLSRTFHFEWFWRIFDSEFIIELFSNVPGILWSFVLALCACYGLIRKVVLKPEGVLVHEKEKKYANIITGITVLSVIAFVYLVFSGFQIFGIVNSDVALPEGYTYARYAREGFFQLFALALINMLIVLISLSRFEKNLAVRSLLYVMCGCTYVMIFASAYKMSLYISVYNLTFLRLMVLWALLVIAFLMVLVIFYIRSGSFSLFKRGLFLVTVSFILALFARPDYQIAHYNLNYGNQETMDYEYLCCSLSMDAYPAIMRAYAKKAAQQSDSVTALQRYYRALDQNTIESYEESLAETLREKYDREKGFSIRRLNLSREYVAGNLKTKLTDGDPEEKIMTRAWNGV